MAKPGKSPFGSKTAVLEPAGSSGTAAAAAAVLRAAKPQRRYPGQGEVPTVHGWTRVLGSSEVGACLAAPGHTTWDRFAGQAVSPGWLSGQQPRVPLPCSSLGAGVEQGGRCGHLCTPSGSPESGLGSANSGCFSHPAALGALRPAARGTQRVPSSILCRGSECGPPPPPLTCGGCVQPPVPPQDQAGWVKLPSPGAAGGRKRVAETFCPLFPSRAGLRRVTREKEGRKEGREGREGVRPLCNIIGCVAGLVLAGKSEHAHWGGIKGGQPERPACLLARGAGSRE